AGRTTDWTRGDRHFCFCHPQPAATRIPADSRMARRKTMAIRYEAAVQGIDMTVLLTALTALRKGDFSVRLPLDWTGVAGKVADTFNEVLELNERMARELARLSRVVGKEGKIDQR